jgi:hypothetical protein
MRRGWFGLCVAILIVLVGKASAQAETCVAGAPHVAEALNLYTAGAYTDAMNAFSCAIAAAPTDYSNYVGRMQSAVLARDYVRAVNDANTLNDYAPDLFTTTLQNYDTGLAANPNDIHTLMFRALLNWVGAQDGLVIADTELIIQLDPQNAFAWLFHGSSNKYLGDEFTPFADFQMAVNLDEGNYSIYALIGSTHAQTNSLEDALLALNRAILLNPQDARSYYFRGVVYSNQQDYSSAIQEYTTAINLQPTYLDPLFDRAQMYTRQGNLDAAMNDFNRILELDSGYKLAYLNRGVLQEWAGNIAAALPDFARYIELNTTNGYLPALPALIDGVTPVQIMPNQTAQLVISGSVGQIITITAASPGGRVDPLVLLLAPDGVTPIAGSDDPSSGERSPRIASFVLPQDGAYILYVTSSDPFVANQGQVDVTITAG